MTRNELRELLLATGLEMLKKEGLATGAERLTFKRVFDQVQEETGIRVTNASVIRRIWRDNEDYQRDVLNLVMREEGGDALDAAVKKATQVLKKADLTSLAGRKATVSELCRVAGGAHADALAGSQPWHLFVGTWGNMASRPDGERDERLTAAAQQTYVSVTNRLVEVFSGFMETLGLRVRDGLTLQQLALATVAFSEGCGLRDQVDPASTRRIRLPTGPGARRQDWRLFSIGFEALVWHFLELDPRFKG